MSNMYLELRSGSRHGRPVSGTAPGGATGHLAVLAPRRRTRGRQDGCRCPLHRPARAGSGLPLGCRAAPDRDRRADARRCAAHLHQGRVGALCPRSRRPLQPQRRHPRLAERRPPRPSAPIRPKMSSAAGSRALPRLGGRARRLRLLAECWDQMRFGLRLGRRPRVVATTTPRPLARLKALLADPRSVVTRAATSANPHLDRSVKDELERRTAARASAARRCSPRCSTTPMARSGSAAGSTPAGSRRPGPVRGGHRGGPGGDGHDRLRRDGHRHVRDERSRRTLSRLWRRGTPLLRARGTGGPAFAGGLGEAGTGTARSAQGRADDPGTQPGGDMVKATIHQAVPDAPVRTIVATKGKADRAMEVSILYEQGRVHHVGALPVLEDQQCSFPVSAEHDDLFDALVYSLAWLKERRGPIVIGDGAERAWRSYRTSPGRTEAEPHADRAGRWVAGVGAEAPESRRHTLPRTALAWPSSFAPLPRRPESAWTARPGGGRPGRRRRGTLPGRARDQHEPDVRRPSRAGVADHAGTGRPAGDAARGGAAGSCAGGQAASAEGSRGGSSARPAGAGVGAAGDRTAVSRGTRLVVSRRSEAGEG